MKKILFINPSLTIGGAEKVLITILKNFDYSQYEVELLLIFKPECFVEEVPKQVKLSIVYPQLDSFRQTFDFFLYYKFDSICLEKCSVIRALKSKKYDTIVSFLEGRALKAHSYITDRAKRNITWVHTDMVKNHYTTNISMKESLERKAYSLMDKVVFVSKESMSQFNKLGYSVKNEVVVYNPVEKDFVQSFLSADKNENDTFTIVLCGRVETVKAYDRMIRVARRLKDDGFVFKVNFIGDGTQKEPLKSMAEDLGVDDVVNFLGFVAPPYSEMAKADLFVSTSVAEGYPVNICEAICLGLPIVATRCAGTTEILSDGDDFALLAEQNDDSIYECVKKMMDDNEFRQKCRGNAIRASSRFSMEKTMSEIYQLL